MPFEVGSTFIANSGDVVKIVHYYSSREVLVRFVETYYETLTNSANLLAGKVKDYTKPTVYGVGVLGESYKSYRCKKSYNTWVSMLQRCYSEVWHKRQPTYLDCEVCEEWQDYPKFKEWFDINYKEGCELDKDLSGKKIYSPDNCIFIPKQLNRHLATLKSKGYSFHSQSGKYRCNTPPRRLFSSPDCAAKEWKNFKKAETVKLAEELLLTNKIDSNTYSLLIKMEIGYV